MVAIYTELRYLAIRVVDATILRDCSMDLLQLPFYNDDAL